MATEHKTFYEDDSVCFLALTNPHGIRVLETGKKQEKGKAWATP